MTKTSADYSQVKFRPGAGSSLEKELAARSEQAADIALSQVAKRDLERLYTLYRLSLPTFSESEAIVIVNALNGAKAVQPELAHRLYVDVQESLEESESYHVVDDVQHRALIARLRGLSRFECIAIYDAAERFWLGGYHKAAEEVSAKLREVGLVK